MTRYTVKRDGRYWFSFTPATYNGVQKRIMAARMQGRHVTTTGHARKGPEKPINRFGW